MKHGPLLRLNPEVKSKLRLLFLAKWAEGDGTPQPGDGTHAVYHAELREVLKELGFQVEASGRMERLFEDLSETDFIVSFMNRFGFSGSEMLAPLLATFARKPFFGAHPIIRGLGDDKHLMKLAVRGRGVLTPDWMIVRRGALEIKPPAFSWDKLIVKPNASSASWGIGIYETWQEALAHIHGLLQEGHDVIVENFVAGFEVAQPVVGSTGPWLLPALRYAVADDGAVRSYEQKRHLEGVDKVSLEQIDDAGLQAQLQEAVLAILPEVWPHDFARMEFKYDPPTDTLHFIEINLNCNLWSQKSCSKSAQTLGVTHHQFVETLMVHSLRRQGVVANDAVEELAIA